jgi:putative endonuclease
MTTSRSRAGQAAFFAGTAAEAQVLRHYQRAGLTVVAQRWRGKGGEIDLIARDGDRYVFVEVKAARDLATAACRVSPRQIRRLAAAAEEFLGTAPDGLGCDLRFDVALVDGQGRIDVLENALIDL